MSSGKRTILEALRAYAADFQPSQDLERYVLERGRYHLRDELLHLTARTIGREPDARTLETIVHVTRTELVPHLRAAIYAPKPLSGRYVPSTEGSTSNWAHLAGEEGAAQIAEQRQRWEAAHGLIRDGRHPVSGSAIVVDPPGAEGYGLTWLNPYGDDECRKYGHHVHLLTPEASQKALFVLGDSHNAAELGQLHERALTHAEAALLAATFGRVPYLDEKGEAPYIEALIPGGVDLDKDAQKVHSYSRLRGLRIGERAEDHQGSYLERRVLQHLGEW